MFRSAGAQFDDIALVTTRTGPLAFFSDASGLYERALDAYGLPRSRAVRLSERCDAGLAAAVSGNDVWIACARRPGHEVGAVTVYQRGAQLQERGRFTPVGQASQGVSLRVHQGHVMLAWQDAAIGGARLRFAESVSGRTRVLSDPEWFASTPQLMATGTKLLAVWGESQERQHRFESRVQMLELEGHARSRSPTTVAHGQGASPSPAIAADEKGAWLAFRDRRKGQRKSGLYLTHLDARGSTGGDVRVGRADGVGRPTLSACLSGLVAATPRTFAGDYFVGVVHADRDLRAFAPEQQFYEDSHEFSQVAAACLDARLLFLIAERGHLGGGRAALRSVGFTCE